MIKKKAQEDVLSKLPDISDHLKGWLAINAKKQLSRKELNFLQKVYDAHGDMQKTKVGKLLKNLRNTPYNPFLAGNGYLRGLGTVGRAGLTGLYLIKNSLLKPKELSTQKGIFLKNLRTSKTKPSFLLRLVKSLLRIKR